MSVSSVKPSNAWAWVGIIVSVGLNIMAAVWVTKVLSKPDYPLCPPPAIEKSK